MRVFRLSQFDLEKKQNKYWENLVFDLTVLSRFETGAKRISQPIGTLFLLLAAALGIAGTGWLRRRKWAWQLAVIIIATQVLKELANTLRGQVVQGSVGVMVAGAFLLYMTRPYVRSVFATRLK